MPIAEISTYYNNKILIAIKDALVVCRLRRKCDYHAVDGANGRDTQSQSLDPSVLMASSGTYSGCDGELNNRMYPTRDKMAECSANRSSSSHDSHSVEKIDTSSQSDLKAKDETVLQPDQPTSHVSLYTSHFS